MDLSLAELMEAKSKARIQRYEELVQAAEKQESPPRRSSFRSPSGSATVVDFEHLSEGLRRSPLIDDLTFRSCRRAASSA